RFYRHVAEGMGANFNSLLKKDAPLVRFSLVACWSEDETDIAVVVAIVRCGVECEFHRRSDSADGAGLSQE
ncbi:MAG TPA: hypothetical protein PK027_05380, partial [Aquimonas sp.]|nr:hypothetical protein [Aquimonas sp.]